jgi:hypothetical protein
MAFRSMIRRSVRQGIASWGLTDDTLVDVYRHLNETMPQTAPGCLDRVKKPFDGMVYPFTLIDPQNRLCEHVFAFQVLYSQDEETLVVAKGVHLRRFWA